MGLVVIFEASYIVLPPYLTTYLPTYRPLLILMSTVYYLLNETVTNPSSRIRLCCCIVFPKGHWMDGWMDGRMNEWIKIESINHGNILRCRPKSVVQHGIIIIIILIIIMLIIMILLLIHSSDGTVRRQDENDDDDDDDSSKVVERKLEYYGAVPAKSCCILLQR